jgi:hypothetical protein
MHHRLFTLLLCCCPFVLCSQTEKPAADSTAHRGFELGLNITNTLGSFLGNTDQNSFIDPYLLSMRIGGPKRRVRLGFGGRFNESDDFEGGSSREVREIDVQVRVGFEVVQDVTPRFAYFYGIDAVLARQFESVQTFLSGGGASLRTETYDLGGGPLFGILFRLHPRVMLLTESSLYATGRTGKRTINAPPDVRTNNISGFRVRPVIPTSLFINFVF